MFVKTLTTLSLMLTPASFAQFRPPNDGMLQQIYQQNMRIQQQLDQVMRELQSGHGGGHCPPNNNPIGYYCTAQCQGNSSTIDGGHGRSQAEAEDAAFDAVRKRWACQMEVVKCSPEFGS